AFVPPRSNGISVTPPVPKVVSVEPSGLRRKTAKSESPPGKNAVVPTTIFPSDWRPIATGRVVFGRFSGTARTTGRPVPNGGSRGPTAAGVVRSSSAVGARRAGMRVSVPEGGRLAFYTRAGRRMPRMADFAAVRRDSLFRYLSKHLDGEVRFDD